MESTRVNAWDRESKLIEFLHRSGKDWRIELAQIRDGKLLSTEECWPFSGHINLDGYGVIGFRLDGKQRNIGAHRLSAIRMHGAPQGDRNIVDHLCRNRSCINPSHLEWVTDAENKRRGTGWNRSKMCRKGLHEMTDDNIILSGPRKGRSCLACHRIRRSEYYWKNPELNQAKALAYYHAKKQGNSHG